MPFAEPETIPVHQIVPKASAVAEPLHQEVPEPFKAHQAPSDVASSALACPRTGAACPALSALFASFAPAGDDARGWILALAPCGQCRVAFEAGRDGLRHVRLGQREREVLLGAAAGPLTLTEAGMTRSLSAARRRAALSLGKAGLVAPEVASSTQSGAAHRRATVVLTELGHYVMAAYGRYLSAGKPVRWTRPARGVSLPGRDPAELVPETLSRTETALRDTLTELKGVLIAAIGGRLKDPARLDAVTRHLEEKATLLKAVLGSARPARG